MYRYQDVAPVNAPQRTVWLVHDQTKKVKLLQVWHDSAQIEDVVEAYRSMNPTNLFAVYAMDVGSFVIDKTEHSMHNARGVDQSMNIYLEMDTKEINYEED